MGDEVDQLREWGDGFRAGPIELATTPRAPASARRFIRSALAGIEADRCSDAELVVSELVTNVVVHTTCSHLLVTLTLWDTSLRIAVADCDTSPVLRRAPGESELGGRGLCVLDEIAERWSTETTDDGKVVWAVLRTAL